MPLRSYQYQVQVLYTPGTGGIVERTLADVLGITDEATWELNTTAVSVEDGLGLTDQVNFVLLPGGINVVAHDLGLTDEVHVFGWESLEHTLNLSDSATFAVDNIRKSVTQNLGLSDSVEYGYLVRNITVEQDLGIDQEVRLTKDFAVSQSLGLTDYASFTDINQNLGLTDTAEWGYGFDASHNLGLTDQVLVDKILNQQLVDGPFLTQAVSYFVESRCNRYTFNSFHGSGGVEPADKKLNYTNTFLIQSLDTGQVLTLRNPEVDDRRRYAFNRVNREFFDGTADIFADDNWVTEQTQLYTLTAVKRADVDTLFTFLLDNLGREVLVKDWKGVTWIVIITNPGEVYTEDGEGYWTIEFEVVGEEVDGEYVVEPLGLSENLSRAGSIWTRSVTDTAGITDRANRHYNEDLASSLALSDSTTFTIESP